MTVHHFGSTVDGSVIIEQVAASGPANPAATDAPKRPARGLSIAVKDKATGADLAPTVLLDNGYWTYTTTDIPLIRISLDGWVTEYTVRSQEAMDAAASSGADSALALSTANTAKAAADAATAAVATIPGQTWDSLPGKPSTFPPSTHVHPTSQLTVTATVKALLDAQDPQQARTAIGAGTGNGTSNLALGTTATTAAPGNHTHGASSLSFTPTGSITATDVQGAIVQAASTGGSGTAGTSDTLSVIYASGAYPSTVNGITVASPPAYVKVRQFYGPVQPTVAAVAGVLDLYRYANLT